MRIDKRLNLVIPIERETGTVYVHSMPISAEVFDRYYLPIARTYADISRSGIVFISAPRVAAKMLKKTAIELGVWEGPEGVEAGLVGEMRRLSSVITLGDNGWQQTMLDIALKREAITAEEYSDVENMLTFFMVSCSLERGMELQAVLAFVCRAWRVQTTLSNATEFRASLTISKEDESSGVKATALSIAS